MRHQSHRDTFLRASLLIIVYFCTSGARADGSPERGWPIVCRNKDLVNAVRIISVACEKTLGCSWDNLAEMLEIVDKPTLLGVLRNPALQPVHLFFPAGKFAIRDSLDWKTIKSNQVESLRHLDDPTNSIFFIVARSSQTGSRRHNEELAQMRLEEVMRYLRITLRVRARAINGLWIPGGHLELSASDAQLLGIDPKDFRDDSQILNQAVHIFVFPCADLL